MTAPAETLVHRVCVYASDEEFLRTAVPFTEEGLFLGEPVLLATTPATAELLTGALGEQADDVVHAGDACLDGRPHRAVTAFYRYWKRHSRGPGHARVLVEPVWDGRPAAEVAAWQRVEAGVNAVLGDTRLCIVCAYDARVAGPGVLDAARRTHPSAVAGPTVRPCPEYVDPAELAGAWETGPLPPAPRGVPVLRLDGDLRALRSFTLAASRAAGLTEDRAMTFATAVSEVGSYLWARGGEAPAVRVWHDSSTLTCEVHQPGGRLDDRFLGYRPPGRVAAPDDGIWLARQICDRLETRSGPAGCTFRLHFPIHPAPPP
ncbi:sensor histidine kinase [Bailinhaonella thermotolerans]|nr:sensor histidine kinase [Bailinhaonella thermotolerans]